MPYARCIMTRYRPRVWSAILAVGLACSAGCDRDVPVARPAEPEAPAQPVPEALPSGIAIPPAARSAVVAVKPAVEKPVSVKPPHERPAAAKAAAVEPAAASPEPVAAKPEPAAANAEPAAAKPALAAAKVEVPRTSHVHVDVPKGLQAWLDADTRMQPWVTQVMNVAERCYAGVRASDAQAAGVIVVVITMHKDERPDADIKALPPQLSGVVACATGDLMRTHMPLFTGAEGDKQTVRIHFE
jgi:hypothetical protein